VGIGSGTDAIEIVVSPGWLYMAGTSYTGAGS